MKRKLLRIFSLVLVLSFVFSFASCGKNTGEMTDQSNISKTGSDNTVNNNNGDTAFVKGYYNWLYSEAFNDFAEAVKVAKIPSTFENAFEGVSEERKISTLRSVFCSSEVLAAVQTASEYESGGKKYTHKVSSVKKVSKGVYTMKIFLNIGGKNIEKQFELKLSKETRKIRLNTLGENGKAISFHEIIVTNDGYVAVNIASESTGGWGTLQCLFKGGTTPEGYMSSTENMTQMPESIYENSIGKGFAGK